MKSSTDLTQALLELHTARVRLITASEKEIPDERLKKINKVEEKIRNFQQFNSYEERGVLFMHYLKLQGQLQTYIDELKTIVSEFAADNPKIENLPKVSSSLLPLYFLKYTAPSKEAYDSFLQRLSDECFMLEMKRFTFNPNPEKLSIDIIGYQPQAKTTVMEILEDDFSKYCKYKLTSSRPSTPMFFNSSQSSTPNKVNTTSTTPMLTGSDSENNKKIDPNSNFKL